MKDFRLQLNPSPNGVYLAGTSVTGTVVAVTSKPKDFKTIEVRIVGEATVHWTETRTRTHSAGPYGGGPYHSQHRTTETVTYHSHETYIDTFVRVWDKEACGGSSFPVGSHSFPFSLQLVGNLPSSYEGTVGRIRYKIICKVVKSGLLKRNKTCEAVLRVASVVDINTPILLQPKAMEVQKTICCLCCASGPIVITARIPRSGYCTVTDAIPLEVVIENGSNRNVHNVAASIHKFVQYTARGRHRHDSATIISIVSDRITAHNSLTWRPTSIIVPNTVPTMTNCEIIKVYYRLDIIASVPWAINPSISFPITIGNIPLQSTASTYPAAGLNRQPYPPIASVPYNQPFPHQQSTPYNQPFPRQQSTPYNQPFPPQQPTPYNQPFPPQQPTPYNQSFPPQQPTPYNQPFPPQQPTPYNQSFPPQQPTPYNQSFPPQQPTPYNQPSASYNQYPPQPSAPYPIS